MVGTTALWLVLCATLTTAVSVKFHHHLSENDLELYFGTRNSREVPKYDIVHPVRRRHPRTSLIHPPLLQYRLKALGEEYDLHLERNQHLVAPGCLMTHTDGKGGAMVSPCPRGDGDCFYTGTSTLHNGSYVALGTCDGLHGVISTPTHQLLIQPIRGQHLADVNIGRDAGAPHLVYHLTARGMCGVQDTAEQIVPRRVRRQAGGLFLEMLLVADKTMHRYHGDDLVNYMLTAANVAAGRYLDSSLGVPIHLTIISLRVLKDDMDGLNITTDADHTLNSFCQWQEKFNPPGDTDPRHVDAASLMTRENLIHKGVAETTGLASLGGICVKEMRCSILEDNGLDIGLTLAHETGHSLNMQHDSEANFCDDKTNIMSTGGGGGTTAFKWSSCSKDALHNFLYEGNGACLLDSPTVVGFHLPKDLPGVIYPGDKQCELFLGQGSKICEGTSLVEDYGGDECGKLICFDPHLPGQCTGSQAPRMDGTECGHRKWCINGRCADIGPRGPPPRDGGWSDWDSEWSPCSRTCGGGVRIKTRKCDRPRPLFGGKKCEGFDSKAEICNFEPCTTPQSQYREEQCAATDIYPLGGRHLHWLPGDTVGDSVCMLYCSPEGGETIHLRGVGTSTDYKDGTECDSDDGGTYNRCVSGKCRAFGCDGVSDSPTRLDVCGICSGSNNTCEKKTGSFFRGKEKSYVTFLTIPRGSTGIKMTNDNRYTWMSIRVNGQRLFNTNLRHKDKKHAYSRDGVKVLYAPYGPESIQIPGPVPTQLQAQVYRLFGYTYSDVSPEIYYEFYQPLVARLPVRYTWTTREGPCSATCGQGSRQVQAVCGRADTGARVERSRCSAEEEPDTQPTPCHQQPCPPRWHTGVFSPCSLSCGGGLASRTVQCMQHQAGQSQVVEDDQCDPASRPLATQTCGSQPCPGAWRTDPWTDCTQTCGLGVRRRGVRCFLTPHTEVPDDNCELSDKPDVSEPCKDAACFTPPVSPCADNISADCHEYDRRVCSRYREWAQHHCPLFCSLCSQTDHVEGRHREGGQEGAAREQRTDLGGDKAGGQEDGGKGGAEGGRSGGQGQTEAGQIGRQEDGEGNTSEETGGEDGGQIEQQEDVAGGQGARQGEDQDVTDQRSQVGDGEGTGDEDGEERKGVVGGQERAAETVSYSSHPDDRRGYDTTDLVKSDDVTQGENDVTQGKDGATQGQDDFTKGEFDVTQGKDDVKQGQDDVTQGANDFTNGEDDVTQGEDDVTQGKDGATQGQDDVTQGEFDVTQGKDDVKQGEDDVTQGQDDVTQGEFDVTHGEEVTQRKDDVKQGEDDVTQGANDFTKGEDDVTQGEDDVTQGKDGATQGQDDFTKGEFDVTQGKDDVKQGEDDVTQGANDFTNGEDDVTQGEDDVTQGKDGATQGQDDVTQGEFDVTQGKDDVKQGEDDVTQGQDDVTQGEFDVTHGEEVTEGKDDVKQGEDDVTQGANDFTKGEDDVTQGEDDVTQGKDGATQGQDDVTQGEFDVTQGEEVTQGKDDVKQGEDDVTQGANDFTKGEDDVTQGEDDVTQGKDGATQGQDDVTQGEFDVTQGKDDVKQGEDDVTQGQDDVTQGEFDVTHGEEVTEGKDDVKQGEDDVTQGAENGVTQGGANDFTKGEDDVTQGEDDVTRGGNGIRQTGAGDVTNADEDISEDSDNKGRMLKDQECVDVLNSCRQYSQRDCRQFPDWAKQNCQRHCNYCDDDYVTRTSSTTSEDLDCSDVNTQCVEYPDSVCEEYESWARTNCKRRCHFCLQDLGQVAATVTPPCVDASIECIDYHPSVCALYKDWAEINCRKFCHVCT